MMSNDVCKLRVIVGRRIGIGQHERIITSGVTYDVIISWYQVDIACLDVHANARPAAIPCEVRRLFDVGHIVGGLEMTLSVKVVGQHVRRRINARSLVTRRTDRVMVNHNKFTLRCIH